MSNNKRKPNKNQLPKKNIASKCMVIFLHSYYKVCFS